MSQPASLHLTPNNWADFRDALEECALFWGLHDWRVTILVGGDEWKTLMQDPAKKTLLEAALPAPSELTIAIRRVLGLDENDFSNRFFNLRSFEIEPETEGPARVMMWRWMESCLEHDGYYCGLIQSSHLDIAGLYKKLEHSAGTRPPALMLGNESIDWYGWNMIQKRA